MKVAQGSSGPERAGLVTGRAAGQAQTKPGEPGSGPGVGWWQKKWSPKAVGRDERSGPSEPVDGLDIGPVRS